MRRVSLICLSVMVLNCSGTETLPPPNPPATFPIVDRFVASANAVRSGELVTLSWDVRETETVRIDPEVLAPTDIASGSVQTPPLTETTRYTLIAESSAGRTTRTLVVNVVKGDARIISFTAEPALVEPGQMTTLSWETEDAFSVQLAEVGVGIVEADAAPQGSLQVTVDASTVYQLTVIGDQGPITEDVTILAGSMPRVVEFVADPAQTTGGPTTLRWTTENSESVRITDGAGNDVLASGSANGSQSVTPAATTSYMLVASGGTGSAVASTEVVVLPPGSPRILSFTVTPTTLPGPGSVTVDWQTADAPLVDLQLDGASLPSFPRTPSGMFSVMLTADATLTLLAENEGQQTTSQVMITVGTPDTTPPEISFVPPTAVQNEGTPLPLSASIQDTDSMVASATLFYRAEGTTMFDSLPLTSPSPGMYEVTLPGTALSAPGLEYYIQAADTAGNAAASPTSAPATLHNLAVQPNDSTAPQLTHTPPATERLEGQPITLTVDVTDATGVDAVEFFYKRQTDAFYQSVNPSAAGNTYTVTIPGQDVLPPGLDYYFEARDTIVPANIGREPAMTDHQITVQALDRTAPVFVHTPVGDGQSAGTAVDVAVDVTDDDSGVGAVVLFYRPNGNVSFTSVTMTGNGSSYTAQIPGADVSVPSVSYYIQATDLAMPTANTATFPANSPANADSFTVTPIDMAAPTLVHSPIADGQVAGQAVPVTVDALDGTGVTSVTLFHRTQGGTFAQVSLTNSSGDTWVGSIPAGSVADPGVDYYLQATDSSPNSNVARSPMTAPAAVFSFGLGVGEVEPNNSVGTASPLLDASRLTAIGVGSVTPSSDTDYWIIDVPAGTTRYTLSAEVTVGGPGQCSGTDPHLRLLDTDGTSILVSDDIGGVFSCPFIDPTVDVEARALAPGRYTLRLVEDGGNATIARYELRVSLTPVTCGNSLLESAGGEQCDDGNTTAGDGCSATCQLEPAATFNSPGGNASDGITAGDVDVFAVVMPQGGFLTAFTDDGSGGCNGDTVLELYDTDGISRLATDDDGGPGRCSRLEPDNDPATNSMAAGTYYLRVRGYATNTVVSSYQLTVTIADSICGNGMIEGSEQCDDDDTTSGDGCSSTCQWETSGMASGTGGTFMDSISPSGNKDWFQVTVGQGMSIRAETGAPTAGVCTSADTVIRLYAADRATELTSDDDDGIDRCSSLSPVTDAEVRNLAAGTYWVTVEEFGNNAAIAAYVLDITIEAPVCGDGWVGTGETCDDGNMVAGDGCNAACAYEGPGEMEPNDTRAQANAMPAGTSVQILGALAASGDDDWYSFTVPAASNVVVRVEGTDGGCPVDSRVTLYDGGGSNLTSDTVDGPDDCGRISPGRNSDARNMQAGTYYVRVDGDQSNATYALMIDIYPFGCGDLYVNTGEACDDGNTVSGDGCSATCTFEQTETEPNNDTMTAQAMGAIRMIDAQIGPAGEEDWFEINVTAGQSLVVYSHEGARDQCSNADTIITVYDSMGTELARDEGDGAGFCSIIYADELSNLAAGTYRIKVEGYRTTATFDYDLSVEVR